MPRILPGDENGTGPILVIWVAITAMIQKQPLLAYVVNIGPVPFSARFLLQHLPILPKSDLSRFLPCPKGNKRTGATGCLGSRGEQ